MKKVNEKIASELNKQFDCLQRQINDNKLDITDAGVYLKKIKSLLLTQIIIDEITDYQTIKIVANKIERIYDANIERVEEEGSSDIWQTQLGVFVILMTLAEKLEFYEVSNNLLELIKLHYGGDLQAERNKIMITL